MFTLLPVPSRVFWWLLGAKVLMTLLLLILIMARGEPLGGKVAIRD